MLVDQQRNVYSQYGEDGIIDAILAKVPNLNLWCVEFGAWDGVYLSNTRALIEEKSYGAVLIEANPRNFLKLKENVKTFDNITAMNAFVGFSDRDSLDKLLSKTACPQDFDFLSIDIDGNDIHVWRAMTQYRPKVICIEFNPTIPTEVVFEQPADPKISWGSSLASLVKLGKEKGYELVCVNALNAFFVIAELFPRFSIADNSPSTLRPRDAARTFVFAGYDGTLISTGDIDLPWHGLRFSSQDIQPIPAFLRKYPLNYNYFENRLFRAYHFFVRERNFFRSGGRPSAALRSLLERVRGQWQRRSNPFLKAGTRIISRGFGDRSMGQAAKKLTRRWLSERTIGAIDFYRFPERGSAWGGPFNGQSNRLDLFKAIVDCVHPAAIVETGTYLGTTTEYMAETGLPLYSIEGNSRNFGYARARLQQRSNVSLRQGDSRTELDWLLRGPLRSKCDAALFFYLDAHWGADLPLAAEIDIIFSRSAKAVVMIDDFQVPNDPGFGYDDYGLGKALNFQYIAPLVQTHGLMVFYPSAKSDDETGARRGCVLLCKSAALGSELESVSLLRRAMAAAGVS